MSTLKERTDTQWPVERGPYLVEAVPSVPMRYFSLIAIWERADRRL